MAVALKRKQDTLKRENETSEDSSSTSTMSVGFDVRRRKQQGAWKNAGKAIIASNNLQKIKSLNKNAGEGGDGVAAAAAAAAAAATAAGGGLSRGRTLSGNPVRNDAATLAKVAALSLSASPEDTSVDAQNGAGSLMRPRSAAAMKRAMGLDRTSSSRTLDERSPSAALRRATSLVPDDVIDQGVQDSAVLAEDVTERLEAVEAAVDNMGAQLAVIQDAMESQTKMLKQVLQLQQHPAAESLGRGGGHGGGSPRGVMSVVYSAEQEIAMSVSARSDEKGSTAAQTTQTRQRASSPSVGVDTAGDENPAVPMPTTAPPGVRRKTMPEDEGDLNVDDEDLATMDVQSLLAVTEQGHV